MLSQAAIGGHHRVAKVPAGASCDVCGIETRAIFAEIDILQHHPKWRKRDDAAHDLRKFDPNCHPEVVAALSTALLTDGKGEVREEAAESLGKLGTCTPDAHAALRRAASLDPDRGARREARRALQRIGNRRCEGACSVCGTGEGTIPVGPAVPVGEPSPAIEGQAPARIVVPPDLGPLGPSPLAPREADETPRLELKPVPPPERPAVAPAIPDDAPVAPPAEGLPLEPPLELPKAAA